MAGKRQGGKEKLQAEEVLPIESKQREVSRKKKKRMIKER